MVKARGTNVTTMPRMMPRECQIVIVSKVFVLVGRAGGSPRSLDSAGGVKVRDESVQDIVGSCSEEPDSMV